MELGQHLLHAMEMQCHVGSISLGKLHIIVRKRTSLIWEDCILQSFLEETLGPSLAQTHLFEREVHGSREAHWNGEEQTQGA